MNNWDQTQSNFKQLWNLTNHNGCWTIQNAYSGQALEIGSASTSLGAEANQFPDSGSAHQRWQLVEDTSFEEAHTIRNVMDPAYYMEVYLGDVANDVPIVQAPSRAVGFQISNTTFDYLDLRWAQQQWFLRDVGNGAVAIINRNSRDAMQISGTYAQTLNDGEPATQSDYVGSDVQQWYLIPHGGGNSNWYYIRNSRSGLFLTKPSNNAGDKILQKQFTNDNTQVWQINFSALNRSTASASGQVAPALKHAGPTNMLTLYPNPATSTLSLSIPGTASEPTSVQVTDLRGGRTKARYQGHGQVDVADLAPGLYLVTVTVGQQQYRQKFVKE
jgi:hypothetical protein